MAVLLKCGAIFLHVPKTGGSWVTAVLRQQGLVRKEFSHIHADMVRVRFYRGPAGTAATRSYERLKSLVPRRWKAIPLAQQIKHQSEQAREAKSPFCFCFVRHPLRWYESWWRYMNGRSGADWTHESDLLSWHPCGVIRGCGAPDFGDFMRNVNRHRPGFVTELYGLYTQPGITFVGRQEHLVDDLVTVLRRLNVDFDEQQIRTAQPVNASHAGNFSVPWPDDVELETLRLEYAGLVRYGYAESP